MKNSTKKGENWFDRHADLEIPDILWAALGSARWGRVILEVPGEAGAEDGRVERVAGHGVV